MFYGSVHVGIWRVRLRSCRRHKLAGANSDRSSDCTFDGVVRRVNNFNCTTLACRSSISVLESALRGASHALALPVALPVCSQRVVSCAVIQMRRPILSSRIVCATQRSVGSYQSDFQSHTSCPYGQSSQGKSCKRRRHRCVAVALRSVASAMPKRRAKPSARAFASGGAGALPSVSAFSSAQAQCVDNRA